MIGFFTIFNFLTGPLEATVRAKERLLEQWKNMHPQKAAKRTHFPSCRLFCTRKHKQWIYFHTKTPLKHFYFIYIGKYKPIETEFGRSSILVQRWTLTCTCAIASNCLLWPKGNNKFHKKWQIYLNYLATCLVSVPENY